MYYFIFPMLLTGNLGNPILNAGEEPELAMQKLEKTAESWALTAWRLDDGEAVYWSPLGWSDRFSEAEVFFEREAADAALVRAQTADVGRRIIVAPYLFEVLDAQGGRIPASVRERIRARGPTTRTDLGKQAPEANVPVSAKAGLKTDQFLGFSTVR